MLWERFNSASFFSGSWNLFLSPSDFSSCSANSISTVPYALFFSSSYHYNNLPVKDKNSLGQVVHIFLKVIRMAQSDFHTYPKPPHHLRWSLCSIRKVAPVPIMLLVLCVYIRTSRKQSFVVSAIWQEQWHVWMNCDVGSRWWRSVWWVGKCVGIGC